MDAGLGGGRGQLGNYTAQAPVAESFGVTNLPATRPLNIYVPNINAWQCPADHGDVNYNCPNCFTGYGNSYCPEHVFDVWAVEHITADTDPTWNNGSTLPIKGKQMLPHPATKIIQGDWEWENQSYNINTNQGIWWHHYKGERRFNMLFGDGHVVFYTFPANTPQLQGTPPSQTFQYW